jgi:hypothetical protein
MLRMDNRSQVVPYLEHENVKKISFHFEIERNKFRKKLAMVFRLKTLKWALEKREPMARRGFRRLKIRTMQKLLYPGDEV